MFDDLQRTLPGSDPSFFRTVVFECPVPASLSWNLNRQEAGWI
jgi:hypothetical protein